jgi:hypothetical protein
VRGAKDGDWSGFTGEASTPRKPKPSSHCLLLLSPFFSEPVLALNPGALCICIVAIVAAFYATTPIDTGFAVSIPSTIQPVLMTKAFRSVYAGLIDRVCVIRHSNQHVISVGCVISNTAAFETAMVGREVPAI